MAEDPSSTSAVRAGGWSDEAVERLKTLWTLDELPASAIARQLGVSRNAVLGKVHRLGLSCRRPGARPSGVKPAPKPRRVKQLPPRVAAPVRRLRVAPPMWAGLVERLEEVPAHACHWPIGDPQEMGFAFCARPAGKRVYCDAHWALGHQRRSG